MAEISSLSPATNQLNTQSLYFAATQAASQQLSSQIKKSNKKEKTSFAQTFEKQREVQRLITEGLPPELAGMSDEEAVVFLKDAMDMAGDELKAKQNLAAMENYRKKVGQFMKYVVRNNFEFIRKKDLAGTERASLLIHTVRYKL